MKKISVITSGGDAPGMNAALRAVVRTALSRGVLVEAAVGGYSGIIRGDFKTLDLGSMANVIQRGGTIIKTGRSMEFMKPEGRQQAAESLRARGIEGLVVIGGDGSFRGAQTLQEEHKISVVGVPGTIDNDIYGTDTTIGFDTAINTALEAIDRIRDTAASHDRLFIVEVMGRESGFIATHVGLAGGAEEIFFADNPITVDQAINTIKRGLERGKKSSILVTAEGQKPGRAYDLAESIRKKTGFDAKVCILGHVQRGGSPTAADRVVASRMGAQAVEWLLQGQINVMTGLSGANLVPVPLSDVFSKKKTASLGLVELARTLSL
jgi:6-phosphofructokinase 1